MLLTSPESHCHFLGHGPKSRLHQRGAADTALVLECWNVTPRGPEDSFGREDRLGLTIRGCQISSLFGTVCKRGCWSISELLCKQCGAEEKLARPAGCFCFSSEHADRSRLRNSYHPANGYKKLVQERSVPGSWLRHRQARCFQFLTAPDFRVAPASLTREEIGSALRRSRSCSRRCRQFRATPLPKIILC